MDSINSSRSSFIQEEPHLLPEIMEQITQHFIKQNSFRAAGSLKLVSKAMRQSLLLNYRGPLKNLGMNTAKKVIEFAREFGSYLQYLDISNDKKFDTEDLSELLQYLPKLKTLIEQEGAFNKDCLHVLASSANLQGLRALVLWGNPIADLQPLQESRYLTVLKKLSIINSRETNDESVSEKVVQQVSTAPFTRNLEELELDIHGNDAFEIVINCEALQNLRALSIDGYNLRIDPSKISSLSQNLRNLRKLKLPYVTEQAVCKIANSENFKDLERLSLEESSVGSTGAEAVAGSRFLNKLKKLKLDYCQLNAEAVHTLFCSENLTNLERLHFKQCPISKVEGLTAFPQNCKLTRLFSLRLEGCDIGPSEAEALGKMEGISNLVELNLAGNLLDSQAAMGLAQSTSLNRLETLKISSNSIGNFGLTALIRTFTHLKSLKASYCEIGDKAVEAIANTLENLEELSVMKNHGLSDISLFAIAESKKMARLKSLNIKYTSATSLGINRILVSRNLKSLRVFKASIRLHVLGDFKMRKRPKLLSLSEEQWQDLYRHLGGEEWVKDHLFDDVKLFVDTMAKLFPEGKDLY